MEYSWDNLKVRAFWYDNTMSWLEFSVSVRRIIEKIRSIFPDFKICKVAEDPDKFDVLIEENLSNINEKILFRVDRDKSYINIDSKDKSFNINSHSWYGFQSHLILSSCDNEMEIWVSYDDGSRKRNNILEKYYMEQIA